MNMASDGGFVGVMEELKGAGAVYLDRHFVYKSGKHGPGYINMDPIFTNPFLMAWIGEDLGGPFADEFETVAAPAVGGIVLAQWGRIRGCDIAGTGGVGRQDARQGLCFRAEWLR